MRRPWLCTSLFTTSDDIPCSWIQSAGPPSLLSVSCCKHCLRYNVCLLVHDGAEHTSVISFVDSAPQASLPIRASPSSSISIIINASVYKIQSSPMERLRRCGFFPLCPYVSEPYFWDRYDCNSTQSQQWVINRGSTKVQLAGTNFCLDGDSCQWPDSQPVRCILTTCFIDPVDGTRLKIWHCYDNLQAQKWYYTNDNRIALEDQGIIFKHIDWSSRVWLTVIL